MARIRDNSFLEIPIHFIKVSFCGHGSQRLVCRECGQDHKMHIVGRNSKFQPLCCVNSDTILQRNDKILKKKVWLLHAGQCHGSRSELLTGCPGRGTQETANASQIVAS
jgi:hypothetical protein